MLAQDEESVIPILWGITDSHQRAMKRWATKAALEQNTRTSHGRVGASAADAEFGQPLVASGALSVIAESSQDGPVNPKPYPDENDENLQVCACWWMTMKISLADSICS